MLLSSVHVWAQTGAASPFSNLRYKTLRVTDTIKLDSLSVAPGSLFVSGYADSSYFFHPETSLLVWKNKPVEDSVHVRYRVLPLALGHVYSHKSKKLVDSNVVSLIYRFEDEAPSGFVNFNQLEYNGSYGRSISVGNNQDVVLNSQFNLQANGYILDSIKLEAAITDNTIPFQPEGNTQRLQEFDQIYIRLMKNGHFLQLGDYNLESPPGYFLKFFKRVQGVYYQTAFNLSKNTTNKIGLSGSVAKGQFARNIFQGEEGNQGPYKLTGNNGEQFFIVLAGTEKVFVDNVQMERGENADYIINYNTAEIRFMPRRMITKDSRIQVEFEYQDRNYLNSLIYGWNEMQIGDKLNIRVNAYSNQDAKNQPYLQNLSGEQKRFLSGIGDSIQNAFFPNIFTDTFAANKVLYKMVDTVVNGIFYDSVFVYSTHPDSAIYNLSFSFVGAGRGDYIISSTNANGRVYDWVAPSGDRRQGSYAPVQLLITPKKQQVFTLNAKYQIDSFKSITVEGAASNVDPNLFSKKDDDVHWGTATKVIYDETRKIGRADSLGTKKWSWQNRLSYEYVQERFKAIAPFRSVEFFRDWNVPVSNEKKPDEQLVYASTRLSHQKWGSAAYDFSYYQRGYSYLGYRNILAYDYNSNGVKFGFMANAVMAEDTFQHTAFYRPTAYAEYRLPFLMNTRIGGRYELEHNEIRNNNADTLQGNAFSFDVITAYLRTPEQQKTSWTLTYFTRRDRVPVHNKFIQKNHSNNVDVKLGFYQWKNHRIDLTGTYRQLIVDDTSAVNPEAEETLLGRLEYSGNMLRNAVSVNSLYEFGSGQEQKRSYTFVEVPAGQGLYTWIDYNADGVQQANEFEIALYPDQKKFIKVFTPTNEYVKVNYVNFNFSLTLDPSYYWQGTELNGFKKFISRFSAQSSLQIGNRLLADEGLDAYNPFLNTFDDGSILLANTSLSSNFYFNRSNPKWGLDYSVLYNTGKQLLIYGVEGNQSQQHLYKLRWNLTRTFTFNFAGRYGERSYNSALEDNRTYKVFSASEEPSLTWLFRSALRLTAGFNYEERNNAVYYGDEKAFIRSARLELRYSKPMFGVVQLRGSYSGIIYKGALTAPAAFVMLDALQPGSNYLWYVNWERRIGKGIELSLEYEGRKPGIGDIIHTGRMSVRAIL